MNPCKYTFRHFFVVIFSITVLNIQAQTIRKVTFKANDVIYNSKNDCIYATAPSDNISNGNTVCRLDPSTGKVLQSVYIGTEPNKMALSDDAQYLYVSLENIPRVIRLKLPDMIPDLTIKIQDSLFTSNIYDYAVGSYYISDMKVFPGNSKTIAVTLSSSPSEQPRITLIYDGNKARPAYGANPLYLDNISKIAFIGKDTSKFLGATIPSSFGFLTEIPVTPQGIGTVNSNYPNILDNRDNQLKYSKRDSLIYTGAKIFAPFSNPPYKIVHSFDNIQPPAFRLQIAVEPDPFEDAIYFAFLSSDTLKFQQYHSKTRQFIKNWNIAFDAEKQEQIINLGKAGKLALHTKENIYIFTNCVSSITTKPVITQGNSINLCRNYSVTLSVNTTNKVIWSTGDTTTSINIKAQGQYSVAFMDAQGCAGTASVPTLVTQVLLPNVPIITSNDPSFTSNGDIVICAGENLLVNAVSSDGASISWSTGDTIKSIIISQSGSYYAISTNNNGCQSRSNLFNVKVRTDQAPPKPIIKLIGKTDLCSFENAVLQAPSGYNSYAWSNGATTASITVSPELEENYAVKVSNTNGCKSAFSDFVKIKKFTTPSKPFLLYRDSLLQTTLASSFQYRWFLNGEILPNINSNSYKPLVNGFYSIQSYSGSCNSPFSDWVNVVLKMNTSILDPSVGFIQIYPNPTIENFHVQIISDLKIGFLEMTNTTGQVLKTTKINSIDNQYEFNLSGYAAGTYFLIWKSADNKVLGFKKIVKQ